MYSLVIGVLGAVALAILILTMKMSDLTSGVYIKDADEYQAAIEDLKKAGVLVTLPNKIDMLDNDTVFAEAIARNRVVAGLVLSRNGTDAPPQPKAGTGLAGTPPPHLMSFGWKAVRNLAILDDAATGIGDFTFESEAQSDAVVRKTVLMRGANGFNYQSIV